MKATATDACVQGTSGARELRIIGHAVINEGFLNPRIAQRFGFTFRRINDETIELVKILD
jgi:hypothetical protein